MEPKKEFTMKDLMQTPQEMEELQNDINMLMKHMEADDLKTFLRIEKDEE